MSNSLVLALLLVSAASCSDNDHAVPVPDAGAGAPSAGDGGSPDAGAGETELGGTGGRGGKDGAGAGAAGIGTAGAADGNDSAGQAGEPGGGQGGTTGMVPCTDRTNCDDGRWCNGIELCLTIPGSDVKVCMGPEFGPCGRSVCDEDKDRCDCSPASRDTDHDGYVIPGCSTSGKDVDCDDTDPNRNPSIAEVCDGHDEDCKEVTIASASDGDKDNDKYTDQHCSNKLEYQPLFSVLQAPLLNAGTDCDDLDPFRHPNATELCDNRDNDCNGQVDEVSASSLNVQTYYQDKDGDFWGNTTATQQTLCSFPPPGYAVEPGDCDDANPRVNPGREEICNGIDDDCDADHKVDQPDKPGDLMYLQPYDGITEFECTGTSGWKVGTCPSGRLDCNVKYQDACETIATTMCNCHACGKTCAFSCGDTDCEEIVAVSTGDTHTCAIVSPPNASAGGRVSCWGRNDVGQLGDGTTKNSSTPVWVSDLTQVSAIALGERYSCALDSNSRIVCWGNNDSGQLGAAAPVSPTAQSHYPIQIRARAQWGSPTKLASGRSHACAIFGQGLLACWGANDSGQLGTASGGDGQFSNQPEQVRRDVGGVQTFITNATQVVAGEAHTCVLAAGTVECWGDNTLGEIGEDPDSVAMRAVARPVPGLEGIKIDQIAAAAAHTCARSGSTVYCWGSNQFGELATGEGLFGAPTKISLPSDVESISAGRFFGCARSADGTVRCWGSNDSGQLASAATGQGHDPISIPLPNVTRVFGGDGRHVCALTADSKTWCWGRDDFGQLGNGTISNKQPMPVPVSPISNINGCSPAF